MLARVRTPALIYVLLGGLLIAGSLMHITLWREDTLGRDIQYIFEDGRSIYHGENPYEKVLGGDMRENNKYTTYFPLFFLFIALTQTLGAQSFAQWVAVWYPTALLFNLGSGLIIFFAFYRRNMPFMALFALAFWLFNRWTLYLTTNGQIDYVPVFFLLASLVTFERNKYFSLLLLSLSLAFKQIGVFVVPIYLILVWRTAGRHWLRELAVASLMIGSVPLLTSLPFMLMHAEGFFRSILFSATRYPENHFKVASLDQLIGEIYPWFVGLPAKLPMLALMAMVYVAFLRNTIALFTAMLLVFAIFIDFNSVLFRQYMVWLAPFILLVICDTAHAHLQRRGLATSATLQQQAHQTQPPPAPREAGA